MEKLFEHFDEIHIHQKKNSLTNDVYHLSANKQELVCKIYNKEKIKLTNAINEKSVHNFLSKQKFNWYLSPIVYKMEDILCTKYVRGKNFYETKYTRDIVINVAKILKELHSNTSTTLKHFNIIKKIEEYKNLSPQKVDDTIFKKAKKYIEKNKLVLCHNDIVEGNLIHDETNKIIYLIDYEFAGLNDPYCDLASFLIDGNVPKEFWQDFLNEYFDKTKFDKKRINVWIETIIILGFYWAQANYEITKNRKYQKIFNKKREKLKNIKNELIA